MTEILKLPAKITVTREGGGPADASDVTSIRIEYPKEWLYKEGYEDRLFESAKDFINNAKVTVILEINR